MHTVQSAPALGTIAERIHFPSNAKHPENALLNIIYLGVFHIDYFLPSFQFFIVFSPVWCNMSHKSWHLGTMGFEIFVSCSLATSVTPCGTTAITQAQVAPRYACEALASGHSPVYKETPSAKLHLLICSRNGALLCSKKSFIRNCLINCNFENNLLVLNLAIVFFLLFLPLRESLSTQKRKIFM